MVTAGDVVIIAGARFHVENSLHGLAFIGILARLMEQRRIIVERRVPVGIQIGCRQIGGAGRF